MGAIGNLISGLFGGGAKKAPEQGNETVQDNAPQAVAEENKEHPPVAAALAKAPEEGSVKTNPAEFIKDNAPNSEEEFSTFPLANFFAKLKSLASGTKLAGFLNYGVDLATIKTFDAFQPVIARIKSKISKEPSSEESKESSSGEEEAIGNALMQMLGGMDPNAAATEKKEDSKDPKAKGEELKKLESDLAGLENMLKNLDGGAEAEKTPEAKLDDKNKPSPAKEDGKKAPAAGALDSILEQLTPSTAA